MMEMAAFPAMALVRRELLTSMRRGRTWFLLALAVAGMIAYVVRDWPRSGISFEDMADFSTSLLISMASVLQVACLLLAPAMGAYSIAIEREQDTFDLLWTTLVRPGGVVLAKLSNSVWLFLLVIIAGLPALSSALFLVGVDWTRLVVTSLLVLLQAAVYCLVGIAMAARSGKVLQAILRSYFLVIFLIPTFSIICLAPVVIVLQALTGIPSDGSMMRRAVPVFGPAIYSPSDFPARLLFQVLVGLVFFLYAARSLRRLPEPAKVIPGKPIDDKALLWKRRLRYPFYLIDPLKRRKPIAYGRNPIAAKERAEFGPSNRARCFIAALVFLFLPFLAALGRQGTLAVLAIVLHLAAFVFAPLLLARSFTKERESGGLDLLRLTLLRPRETVAGKLLAGLAGLLPILVPALFWLFLAAGISKHITWQTSTCSFVLIVLHWTFCMSLSMTASLVVRKTTGAVALSYALNTALFVAAVKIGNPWLRDLNHLYDKFNATWLTLAIAGIALCGCLLLLNTWIFREFHMRDA